MKIVLFFMVCSISFFKNIFIINSTDASDISMMSFDNCTTEVICNKMKWFFSDLQAFSCFFQVVDKDDRKIETNEGKTMSHGRYEQDVNNNELFSNTAFGWSQTG